MADVARLTFCGELTGLLSHPVSGGVVDYPVTRQAAIKDVIEALGLPHTEVYGLMVHGRPVGFNHRLAAGERIVITPAVFPIDVTRPTMLRPRPLPRLAFLIDVNAGKLGRELRLLGFDAATPSDPADAAVAEQAAQESRVVLSRDRSCLKRAKIVYGRVVRANDPEEQVHDILAAFGLAPPYAAFSRCLRCNTFLRPVAKETILFHLEPKTRKYFNQFHQCPSCGRVYWPGSHHDRMLERLVERGADSGKKPPGCGEEGTKKK